MLISFKASNYRSFRDEMGIIMEAAGISEYKDCLLQYKSKKYLPAIAIYGKNGGGKSNLIRAFWLGVQFIKNAQRTQYAGAPIPVRPFALNDYSRKEPTSFEYVYIFDSVKYVYGFSATREQIYEEYLYHWPKGQKAVIFERHKQKFEFPKDREWKKKELMSEAVDINQLFFAISCTMNYQPCIRAMKWFREMIYFSSDYNDIPGQIIEHREDNNVLNAIVQAAKVADVGICDMDFKFSDKEIQTGEKLPDDMPEDLRNAIMQFMAALNSSANDAEGMLTVSNVKATSYHQGINRDGTTTTYPLGLADESDGTRQLMAIAPAIEKVLDLGGLLIVDELGKDMNPILMEYVVSFFQSKKRNKNNAQIIFTTHNTELLNMELLRRDQIYLVDKDRKNGASEAYCLNEFSPSLDENIKKGYLLGKYGAIPNVNIGEV